MRKRKSSNGFENESGSWMTTYSDLVTLLLCFFVLLFAFSTIDAQKFEAIIKSFKGSLGVLPGGRTVQDNPYIEEALQEEGTTKELEEIRDFRKLKEELEEYFISNGKENEILRLGEKLQLKQKQQDTLYFDKLEGKISEQMFLRLNAAIEKRIAQLNSEIERLKSIQNERKNPPSILRGYGYLRLRQ